MKKRIIKIALIAIAALLVLAGCPGVGPGDAPDAEPGRLRVNVSTAGGSRNIQQPILAPIEEFVITIERGSETFSETVSVGVGTTTFEAIDAGTWVVTVEGNSSGQAVARGTANAEVVPRQITTISMTIGPLPGEGSLNLELQWPAGLVSDPGVTATLDRRDGGSVINLTGFDIDTGGDPHTAEYLGEVPEFEAGYYELRIALTDGGVVVWNDVAAVRIVEGRFTTGTYTLDASEMNLLTTGDLVIEVDADLQNPYEVGFSGFEVEIGPDDEMIVTATLSPDESPTEPYEWYLNGTRQTAFEGNTITIGGGGASVQEGMAYRLSLLVVHGPVLSSTGASFRVVEE